MKLYKYVSPKRTAIFENLQIRFTPPGSFNDPFEMRPFYEALASSADMQRVLDQTPMEDVLNEEYFKVQSKIPAEIQHLVTPEVFNILAKAVAPLAIDLMPDITEMLNKGIENTPSRRV